MISQSDLSSSYSSITVLRQHLTSFFQVEVHNDVHQQCNNAHDYEESLNCTNWFAQSDHFGEVSRDKLEKDETPKHISKGLHDLLHETNCCRFSKLFDREGNDGNALDG